VSSNYLIRDMPDQDRPRERLARSGAHSLRNDELIAILLRTGLRGQSVLEVAQALLKQFGKLSDLAAVSVADLCRIRGVGRDKAVTLQAAFELARRMARELRDDAPLLDTPERIADFLRGEESSPRAEQLQVLLLNVRRRLVKVEKLADGTQDTLLVNPREVFRSAILANAAAVVLAHNHPSGDPSPSESDIKVTRDLIRAGQLLKIEVLDHIIMGHRTEERPRDHVSLRELGYFYA
jgi:DNA repair protein RadC